MAVLLRFKNLAERSGRVFKFEVDRSYSPLAPQDAIYLRGEYIHAIYRANDGVYVVYGFSDPTLFVFYLAEGVPEGAELVPAITDTVGQELLVAYDPKLHSYFLPHALRGRPPRAVDDLEGLNGFFSALLQAASKRAGGAEGLEDLLKDRKKVLEEIVKRAEKTKEVLSKLKVPEWADGLYFEPSGRGLVTVYPVKRSRYGEGFYFSHTWRPLAKLSLADHDLSQVPLGAVVTRDGKFFDVDVRAPGGSVYTLLVPLAPTAGEDSLEGQAQQARERELA